MYPSTLRLSNISKETYYGSVLNVNGYDKSFIEIFGSGLNQPDIYAPSLGNIFFDWPDYEQMLDLYNKEH
jgi:hypothetical protein